MNEKALTNATLWVFGALRDMDEAGIIKAEGGIYVLTPKGVSEADQLSMDYQPTDEELISGFGIATRGLAGPDAPLPDDDTIIAMIDLLMFYRDDKCALMAMADRERKRGT